MDKTWIINEDIEPHGMAEPRDPATDTTDRHTYIVPRPMPKSRHERRKEASIIRNEMRRHRRDMKKFSAALARTNIFVSPADLMSMS